jgi:hypothetical protein
MMQDKSAKVYALVEQCLNGEKSGAQIVQGIVRTFGFSPTKITEHKDEIRALLAEMPDEFQAGKGGGMSFLNLCVDRDGNQWGEHPTMEALVVLGIAAGMASYPLPRDLWSVLPGGMPYVAFNTGL